MSILMAVIGATIGAVIGSLFMHWRKDIVKDRQQLESKTPYDYALTNAINERDRLRDELLTLRALNNVQTDTERIRNEIGTILSDDGEGASEVVYGGLNGIPIVQHSDGTISPFPRWDGMSTEEAAWGAGAVARAYQANVREDEEHSYLELIDKAIHSEQKVLCIYRNPAGEGLNGNDLAVGSIVNFRYIDGQTRYLTLRVRNTHKGGTHIMHISGEYLDEVSIMGGESHGEIIYRKETR